MAILFAFVVSNLKLSQIANSYIYPGHYYAMNASYFTLDRKIRKIQNINIHSPGLTNDQ